MKILNRLPSLELLRGVAAFFIVGCHLQLHDYSPCAESILSFCDMNVGVFAALSGFLMALREDDDRVSTFDFIKKRFKRLWQPYVFWTAVFLIASALFQYVGSGAVKPKYYSPHFWVFVLFWGDASTHLWFVPSLFYCSILFYPIRLKLPKWFWIISSFVLIEVSSRVAGFYACYPLRLLSFLLLGYGVSGLAGCIRGKTRIIIWTICASTLVWHSVGQSFCPAFVNDWIAVAPLLLVFATVDIGENSQIGRLAKVIGAASMGVYLVHPLITVALSTLIRKLLLGPYGVCVTMFEWILSCVVAFAFAMIAKRFIPRFV